MTSQNTFLPQVMDPESTGDDREMRKSHQQRDSVWLVRKFPLSLLRLAMRKCPGPQSPALCPALLPCPGPLTHSSLSGRCLLLCGIGKWLDLWLESKMACVPGSWPLACHAFLGKLIDVSLPHFSHL